MICAQWVLLRGDWSGQALSWEVDAACLISSSSTHTEAPANGWGQTIHGLILPSRFAQEQGRRTSSLQARGQLLRAPRECPESCLLLSGSHLVSDFAGCSMHWWESGGWTLPCIGTSWLLQVESLHTRTTETAHDIVTSRACSRKEEEQLLNEGAADQPGGRGGGLPDG